MDRRRSRVSSTSRCRVWKQQRSRSWKPKVANQARRKIRWFNDHFLQHSALLGGSLLEGAASARPALVERAASRGADGRPTLVAVIAPLRVYVMQEETIQC